MHIVMMTSLTIDTEVVRYEGHFQCIYYEMLKSLLVLQRCCFKIGTSDYGS